MSWADKEKAGSRKFVIPTLNQAIAIGELDHEVLLNNKGIIFHSNDTSGVESFFEANNIKYTKSGFTLHVGDTEDLALLAAAGFKFKGADVLKESFRTQAALGPQKEFTDPARGDSFRG